MLVKQQLATQEAEFATLIATHCQTLYVFYMSDIPYIPSNVFTKFVLLNVFTKKYIFQYLSLKYEIRVDLSDKSVPYCSSVH